jgi:hypothetical protein
MVIVKVCAVIFSCTFIHLILQCAFHWISCMVNTHAVYFCGNVFDSQYGGRIEILHDLISFLVYFLTCPVYRWYGFECHDVQWIIKWKVSERKQLWPDENSIITSRRIASVLASIRVDHLLNTSLLNVTTTPVLWPAWFAVLCSLLSMHITKTLLNIPGKSTISSSDS